MKFKKKYDDLFEIEASAADREALLEFIRGSCLTLEEGGGPDTMVDEDDLTELHQLISVQTDTTLPLVLSKQAFHELTDIASDWQRMVFAHIDPAFHSHENVKKETADLIAAWHAAAYR